MLLHERQDFPEILKAVASDTTIPHHLLALNYWTTEFLRVIAGSDLSGICALGGAASLSVGLGISNRATDNIDIVFVLSEDDYEGRAATRRELFRQLRKKLMTLTTMEPHFEQIFEWTKYIQELSLTARLTHQGVTDTKKCQMQSVVAKAVAANASEKTLGISNLKPFTLRVVDPLETLVEKLLILGLAQRDRQLPQQERHIFDLYSLLKLDTVQRRIGTPSYKKLKASVSKRWEPTDQTEYSRKRHTAESWYRFRKPWLDPSEEIFTSSVRRAYRTSQLYFGTRPTIEEIEATFKRWGGKL